MARYPYSIWCSLSNFDSCLQDPSANERNPLLPLPTVARKEIVFSQLLVSLATQINFTFGIIHCLGRTWVRIDGKTYVSKGAQSPKATCQIQQQRSQVTSSRVSLRTWNCSLRLLCVCVECKSLMKRTMQAT